MQQHTQGEVWRAIPGYEGSYEASSHGRIRSLDRVVMRSGNPMRQRGRILRPTNKRTEAHQTVCLGKGNRKYVHALVLMAFVGPRPDGLFGCHNDGDPLNNRPENLRWDTPSANQRDRLIHGTHNYGNRTHCANGHEFTPKNTRIDSSRTMANGERSNTRVCLTCQQGRMQAYLFRKAAKAA